MTAERIDREPMPDRTVAASDPTPVDPAVSAMRGLCPFLIAAAGGWRSIDATGEHRCTAVSPPVRLATEKQRRLCLTPSHESCATFVAALAARQPVTEGLSAGTRPMPRTTPVILERGRFAIPTHSLRPDRTAGQAALVMLLGVAFAGILASRLGSGSDGSHAVITVPSASPAASSPTRTPTSSAGAVVPSAKPVEAGPTPQLTLVPTAVTPPPSAPTTYTVQRGDTLSGIAAVYGTTWQVLAELNHIKNPSALKVGAVLQLP